MGLTFNANTVRDCDDRTRNIMGRSRECTTLQGTTTAMTKFLRFISELGIPPAALCQQDSDPSRWSSTRRELHSTLLTAYCSSVTKSHKTAKSCVVYAGKVANSWRQMFGVPLWPSYMFTNLSPYVDGLFKIKMYVKEKRQGLDATDTLVLCQTITAWSAVRRRIRKQGPAHTWGGHFSAVVIGAFQFANGEVFRYGEANCPAGKEFDEAYGITQGDVSIIQTPPGQPDIMRVKPPKFKVRNSHSSEYISCEIRPEDPLNWPTAVLHIMRLDPIHSEAERLLTPLFRDTRSLLWCPVRGGFPPGSACHGGADPIPYRQTLTILRDLIAAESGPGLWFNGRHGPFALHSFRIGTPAAIFPLLVAHHKQSFIFTLPTVCSFVLIPDVLAR